MYRSCCCPVCVKYVLLRVGECQALLSVLKAGQGGLQMMNQPMLYSLV